MSTIMASQWVWMPWATAELHRTFSTMPRSPADITFRTTPPARSAMHTDAATNFSTMPASSREPAAAIMENDLRQLRRRRTAAGDNGRGERISTWASTADACIDLYLRPSPAAVPQPRTIDRHNTHAWDFSIITYRSSYRCIPTL